jgi:hypothetical protein
VFTLCGRVHGYFEENESRQFDWEWQKKHSKWPAKYGSLLLDRVAVKLTGTPSFQRYVETLAPTARQKAVERLNSARPNPPPVTAVPRLPTISASFLNFVEGADPSIRYQRGDPLIAERRSRAVDRETGDYVQWDLPHWQSSTSHYRLYSADGTLICDSTVQQENLDLSGDGQVGLYKVTVLRIAQASADGTWPEITDASSPIAQKLARFIAAFLVDHAPARHSAEITFDLGGISRPR